MSTTADGGDESSPLHQLENGGWDRFVCVFSTISAASSDDNDFASVWLVTSPTYWSVEAVLLFLVLFATLAGNAYFAFASCCSSGTEEDEEQPTADPEKEQKQRSGGGANALSNLEEGTTGGEESPEDHNNNASAMREEEEELPNSKPDLNENENENEIVAVTTTPRTTRPRLYYLDNVKWALVGLVFLQHVAQYAVGAMGPSHGYTILLIFKTLNSAWFMSLFFFVSAYFVPASLERKGTAWFLRDKLKRLGLPMLFLVLLLNALERWLRAVATTQKYQYSIAWGVAWFLLWLQIFNVVYLIIISLFAKTSSDDQTTRQQHVSLPRTAATQIAFGLVVGLVQGGICYAQGGNWLQWGFLRLQWAYAPAYASFYFLGTLAKRNNWLSEITDERGAIYKISMLVASIL